MKYWVLEHSMYGMAPGSIQYREEPDWEEMQTEERQGPREHPEYWKVHPADWIQKLKFQRGEEWWNKRNLYQLECTQQPGDMIYVPADYGHLILNLWPSAAINHEFADSVHNSERESMSIINQAKWYLSMQLLFLSAAVTGLDEIDVLHDLGLMSYDSGAASWCFAMPFGAIVLGAVAFFVFLWSALARLAARRW